MNIKNTTLEVAQLLNEKGILRLKDKEAIAAASVKDDGCLVVDICKFKGKRDCKARKATFHFVRLKEAFGNDARWEEDTANKGEKLLVFSAEYSMILGRVFQKIFDNPYGKDIGFNGYNTKKLDEVRISYNGKKPLEEVATELSKVVSPFGYRAIPVDPYVWGTSPLNLSTYNIKIVEDKKKGKSIKCRLVLNTARGRIADFGEHPSIAAAVRAARDSGYFRYRILVGNKVVREGFCNV